MCGGGALPPDDSLEIRQLELAAEEKARADAAAEAERLKQELAALRTNALGLGRSQAEGYFSGQGLDPSQYASAIERELQTILMGIPQSDPNPGAYFTNAGERIYGTEQSSERARLMRALDQIAPSQFEMKRVPWELDDPTLAAIKAEMTGGAENIAQNLLNRGVITTSGFDAAIKEIARQDPRVAALLSEQGNLALEGGRQPLRDIANQARSTVSNKALGVPFDPYEVSGDIDRRFNEFLTNLGSNIRSRVPAQLFDTTGLAKIAGQAQGPQNTAFNPAALAGLITDEEEKPTTAPSGASFF
jgi:hypothetical protein